MITYVEMLLGYLFRHWRVTKLRYELAEYFHGLEFSLEVEHPKLSKPYGTDTL